MSYKINYVSVASWGLKAGFIDSRRPVYALSGAWSLPKRLGDTHYDWQGELDPYVDLDDIALDGRDLTLSLICKKQTAAELKSTIDTFKADVADKFALSHDVLGSFEVSLAEISVAIYGRTWAQLTLKMREHSPIIPTKLPAIDNGVYGIDGHSWAQLGLVLQGVDNRYDLAQYTELSITKSPVVDSFIAGYRQAQTITIQGTVQGATYADFNTKVGQLQSLLSAPGTRTITYFDGSTFKAFCVDGFKITDVCNFSPIHWGRFACKMIVI